jgi:hypothetical protein
MSGQQTDKRVEMFTFTSGSSTAYKLVATDGTEIVAMGSSKAVVATISKRDGVWSATLFDDIGSAQRHLDRLAKSATRLRTTDSTLISIK